VTGCGFWCWLLQFRKDRRFGEICEALADTPLPAGQYGRSSASLTSGIYTFLTPTSGLPIPMPLWERECFAKDCDITFVLAEEGARFDCLHCQGVLADACYRDVAPSLPMARVIAAKDSKYGLALVRARLFASFV